MSRAFIGLGSNLGDRASHFRWALGVWDLHPGVQVLRASRFRETLPEGDGLRGFFLNAVAEVETCLPPRALLASLLDMETRRGRTRPPVDSAGPSAPLDRSLDLDLLLYGRAVLDGPDLVLPHPRMENRRFVMEPLAEIAPFLPLPGGRTPSLCLQKLPRG